MTDAHVQKTSTKSCVPRPEQSIDDMSPADLREYAARLKADLEKQDRLNARKAFRTEGKTKRRIVGH